jgi:hypothetical protein
MRPGLVHAGVACMNQVFSTFPGGSMLTAHQINTPSSIDLCLHLKLEGGI